jgi:Arc/MetJ-type ribon-helix-helix transcriptional regulator
MIYRGISYKMQYWCVHPEGAREHMKLITLYLPETYIKALDQLVDERFYPNRAEAIRVAIRDLISAEVWRRKGVD